MFLRMTLMFRWRLKIFHINLSSVCYLLLLFSFFLNSFLFTHMHNRLVSTVCTRYRSNADDSTLFNCCCRSMALLNFSIHVRLINQMIVVYLCVFFLHREVLVHCMYFFSMIHINSQRNKVI